MSAFETFKQFLRPTDNRSVIVSDPFVVIDRARTIEKLKLNQRAAENGVRNYPAPDSTHFDEVEQDVIAEFREHANVAEREAASNTQTYAQRLSELALLRELSSITASSQTAISDFSALVKNVKGRLALAEEEVRDSYQELMDFKTEHQLKRPAYKGLPSIVVWSTFSISVVVESVLNSLMLKVNDDYGYLGGLLAALVISVVNVGMAAFVGRFLFPSHYHRRWIQRLLALILTSVWFAFTLLWNLLAAHFRDAKAAGFDSPERQALLEFLSVPLQLDSIYSYGLLLLGLIFSIVAAVTALKMRDPYPGYGELYQRHEDRCNSYADEIEDAIQRLTEIRDEADAEANLIRHQLGVQFRERGQVIAARDFHANAYRNHQRHLEEVCNQLLEYYRERNKRARTDGVTPTHFNQYYRFSFSELSPPLDEPTTESEVSAAQEALSRAIVQISAAYDAAVHSLKHLDVIKQELRGA